MESTYYFCFCLCMNIGFQSKQSICFMWEPNTEIGNNFYGLYRIHFNLFFTKILLIRMESALIDLLSYSLICCICLITVAFLYIKSITASRLVMYFIGPEYFLSALLDLHFIKFFIKHFQNYLL